MPKGLAEIFHRLCASGHIPRDEASRLRRRLAAESDSSLPGLGTYEDALPPTDLLSGWPRYRRMSITWPHLDLFFGEGYVSPRREIDIIRLYGGKKEQRAYVDRVLGCYFVPGHLTCDRAFVNTTNHAELLTVHNAWLMKGYGSASDGLQMLVEFHDRADVREFNFPKSQLAWMMSRAAGRAIPPADLWSICKFSTIEGAEAFATSPRQAVDKGLKFETSLLPPLPGDVIDAIPLPGLNLRPLEVVGLYGWHMGEVEKDSKERTGAGKTAQQILNRYYLACRYEFLIVVLHAIEALRHSQGMIPYLDEETLSFVSEWGLKTEYAGLPWSFKKGYDRPSVIVRRLKACRSLSPPRDTPRFLGEGKLPLVHLRDIEVCITSERHEVHRIRPVVPVPIRNDLSRACAREIVPSKSRVATDELENDVPSSRGCASERSSPSDNIPDVGVGIVPSAKKGGRRKIGDSLLLSPHDVGGYRFNLEEILRSWPGVESATLALKKRGKVSINLRELLQGMSGIIRRFESGEDSRRGNRGGMSGTQQARRVANVQGEVDRLRGENKLLNEQVGALREEIGSLKTQLEVALDRKRNRQPSPEASNKKHRLN